MDEEGRLMDQKAIITPPKIPFKDIPTRKHRYIIDSRDRNKKLYPTQSAYQIHMDESLTDVVSAELVLTDFKFNNYNITSHNNILHTSIGDFELRQGVQTGVSLSNELTDTTPFIVTFDPITEKLTITSIETVTLKFKSDRQRQYDYDHRIDVYKEKSVGKVLGFGIEDYELDANVPLEAPYPVDLESANYIIMYMQQAKNFKSKNNNAHDCFAIINKLENSSNGLVMYENNVKKFFNPPIADLKKLVFKFCDYEGNLYDFQNKDHRFEIIFTTLKQTRCYNEIFN